MPKGLKFLFSIVLIAAVVGFFAMRGQKQRRNLRAATITIYGLSPKDLLQECGTPDRDVVGRLAPDDGVRDIHYVDSSGRRLVFRFLADAGAESGWCALGVWTKVTDPDGLGDTVEDEDAVRHLPCLASTAAAYSASEKLQSVLRSRSPDPHLDSRPILVAAFLLPQYDRQAPHPTPMPEVPPIAPLPTFPTFPTPPTPLAPLDHSGAEPFDPPSPEPPPPDPPPSQNQRVVRVPCVGFTDNTKTACELVDSAILVKELSETLQVPNPIGRVDELLTKLTGRDFRVIQLPSLSSDRAATIKAIFRLEIQTINLVTTQLKRDEARLIPFKWDTPVEKARKLEVVHDDEKQTRVIWQQAVEESRPSQSMGSSDDGSSRGRVHMNDNSALRQAIEIHANGWKGF